MRAYTRFDDRPIRRHDSVEEPDAVVVLEPSLAPLADPPADALFLVNSEQPLEGALCIPADSIGGAKGVNMVMLGALAAALGEPELDRLAEAAVEVLGGKTDPAELHAALEGGYAAVKEQRWAA
jgi:Pyruvate/2-oxoacid:ferredoxin oxidoreductase gamma subunit